MVCVIDGRGDSLKHLSVPAMADVEWTDQGVCPGDSCCCKRQIKQGADLAMPTQSLVKMWSGSLSHEGSGWQTSGSNLQGHSILVERKDT